MKSRVEKSRREKEKELEERRYRCAKCWESRETLCFSNDLWVGRVAKAAGAEPPGQMRNEKLRTAVAQSTFPSQNAQNTILGALLEVRMLKNGTPQWREAHFEVNMYKTQHVWTTFGRSGVENGTPLKRQAHFKVKMHKKLTVSNHFWNHFWTDRGRKMALLEDQMRKK